MPYIKQEERTYEAQISILIDKLKAVPEDKRAGHINYIITLLLKKCYPSYNYHTFNEIVGALECIKLELYRRLIGPYEDFKILENGDVE